MKNQGFGVRLFLLYRNIKNYATMYAKITVHWHMRHTPRGNQWNTRATRCIRAEVRPQPSSSPMRFAVSCEERKLPSLS